MTSPERPQRRVESRPDPRDEPPPESEEDLQPKDPSEMPLEPQDPVRPPDAAT